MLHRVKHIDYSPIFSHFSDKQKTIINDLLQGKNEYYTFSPTLGWTIKPNGSALGYQANSLGLRNNEEYSRIPPQGILRIASFGDSFTHGDGVGNKQTWQEVLNAVLPNCEVLNFGVSGFGLDQAYLRYLQEGTGFRSNIVLICFMTENIYRDVNVFRPFYSPHTGFPFTKPRFLDKNNRLTLLPNPIENLEQLGRFFREPKPLLPRLGENDYFYHKGYTQSRWDFLPSVRLVKIVTGLLRERENPIVLNGYYDTESEAFQVTVKIIDQFVASVIKNGSVPVVIVFPYEEDMIRYRKEKTKSYTPLLEYLKERNYKYIDMMDAFEKYGHDFPLRQLVHFHYSPFGNQIIARYLLDYILPPKN